MNHHIWSEKDDIIALYIYLYGTSKLGMNIEKVGLSQGIPVNSLKMRISNIKAIDTGNGLSNFALQTERIYKLYKDYSEEQLRKKGFGF